MSHYEVRESNLGWLKDKLAKLAKRALKLNLLLDLVIGTETRRELDEDGTVTRWFGVDVVGGMPTTGDWIFCGIVSHHGAEGNIVRAMRGEYIPTAYRTAPPTCDHCQTVRKRNETFVVRPRSEDQAALAGHGPLGPTFKRVGRQCLQDFLGQGLDGDLVARQVETLAAVHELGGAAEGAWHGGSESSLLDLGIYLGFVARAMREHGWTSRSQTRDRGGIATADRALTSWNDCRQGRQGGPSPVDQERAQAALDWAQGLEPDQGSDYLWNLRTVALSGIVDRKTLGLAGSMVQAWQRVQELPQALSPVSVHVGEIGQRLELLVQVERVTVAETQYGTTYVHKLRTPEGAAVVWFCSSYRNKLNEGTTVKAKATVTKHSVWKDRPETTVSRLTVLAG